MALRFIVVDDPGAVTVGQIQEAVRLVGAALAVIVEQGMPAKIIRTNEFPADADQADAIEQYVEKVEHLELVVEETPAETMDVVAYESDYAVIMHHETPFLVPALTNLSTEDDVAMLLATAEMTTFGPDIRLPGEVPDLPPDERTCYCPNGHQIVNPPDLICPHDDLPLKC